MKSLSLKSTSVLAIALIASGVVATATPVSATQQLPIGTEGKVNFTAGNLTLDQVPSFDFGTQAITTTSERYDATNEGFVKVTDLRGTDAGWCLTVIASELIADGKTLKDAEMTLGSGQVTNSNQENVHMAEARLVPNIASKVLFAPIGEGNGESLAHYDKTDVTLFVPGYATKTSTAEYKATLTWTLADAPY